MISVGFRVVCDVCGCASDYVDRRELASGGAYRADLLARVGAVEVDGEGRVAHDLCTDCAAAGRKVPYVNGLPQYAWD
jgi:hypothetical protein